MSPFPQKLRDLAAALEGAVTDHNRCYAAYSSADPQNRVAELILREEALSRRVAAQIAFDAELKLYMEAQHGQH